MNIITKVSVIIPCFNAEKWIKETLDSVYSQQGKFELEVIVINDGSTDNTEQIVQKNFPDVILKTTESQGASKARNLGTKISSGNFIQYLDADDLLAENKIVKQLKLLLENNSDIAYGKWQYFVENDQGLYDKTIIVDRKIRNPEIDLFTHFWCPPAVYLFRREIVDKVGGWNENLPIIQDARFALDCALSGAKFVYCDEIAAYYRNSKNNSLSKDLNKFILDCFNNTSEIEGIWLDKGHIPDEKKLALSGNYEFIARVSYNNNKILYEKAYAKLIEYGITDDMIKKNTSKNFYLLNKVLGYKKALYIYSHFQTFKNKNYKSLFNFSFI